MQSYDVRRSKFPTSSRLLTEITAVRRAPLSFATTVAENGELAIAASMRIKLDLLSTLEKWLTTELSLPECLPVCLCKWRRRLLLLSPPQEEEEEERGEDAHMTENGRGMMRQMVRATYANSIGGASSFNADVAKRFLAQGVFHKPSASDWATATNFSAVVFRVAARWATSPL
jgi:hypothetical protein